MAHVHVPVTLEEPQTASPQARPDDGDARAEDGREGQDADAGVEEEEAGRSGQDMDGGEEEEAGPLEAAKPFPNFLASTHVLPKQPLQGG